jgi:hypothetical protein
MPNFSRYIIKKRINFYSITVIQRLSISRLKIPPESISSISTVVRSIKIPLYPTITAYAVCQPEQVNLPLV